MLRTWTRTESGENFGFDAEGIGDVDGDGTIDILTSGATLERVYVLSGTPADPEVPDDTTGPPGTDPDDRAGPGPEASGTGENGGCGCASAAPAGSIGTLLAFGALGLRRRS